MTFTPPRADACEHTWQRPPGLLRARSLSSRRETVHAPARSHPIPCRRCCCGVIALRIGRVGAARHLDHVAHGPIRAGRPRETAAREARRQSPRPSPPNAWMRVQLPLHAEHAFDHDVAGLVGALRVNYRQSGRCAGTAGKPSPGERARDVPIFEFTFGRSPPMLPRKMGAGQTGCTRPQALAIAACECSSSSSFCGQPFSMAFTAVQRTDTGISAPMKKPAW